MVNDWILIYLCQIADMVDSILWAECKCFHQKCLPLSSLACSVDFTSIDQFKKDYKASMTLQWIPIVAAVDLHLKDPGPAGGQRGRNGHRRTDEGCRTEEAEDGEKHGGEEDGKGGLCPPAQVRVEFPYQNG